MSLDIAAIVERARHAAQASPGGEAAPGAERERLKLIAAEFESMLLVQMLKDMRAAGSWEDESQDGLPGAAALFETLDVELARHLSRIKGMGLSEELQEAFDKSPGIAGTAAPAPLRGLGAPATAPAPIAPVPQAVARPAASTPEVAAAVAAVHDHDHHQDGLTRPVAGAVTSAYGWRRDPFTQQLKFHQGVDLKAAYGQEVQAAAAGRVVFSGDQGGYGATVVIEHADGMRSRYAHLSARLVQQGDQIEAGEPLGRAGRSGRATGTHLHFELMAPDGRRIAPDQWASARPAGNPAPLAAGRSIQERGGNAD